MFYAKAPPLWLKFQFPLFYGVGEVRGCVFVYLLIYWYVAIIYYTDKLNNINIIYFSYLF